MSNIDQNAQSAENETIVELSIDEQIALEEKRLKELKAKKKELQGSKGTKVRFTQKDGTVIEGYGVLYYYVTINGKPYMKKASETTVLKEETKEA